MPLCEVCEKIQFFDLPQFPNWFIQHLPVEYEYLTVYDDAKKHVRKAEKPPIGIPFHRTLKSLLAAAKSCDVCSLIEPTVLNTLKVFADFKSPNRDDYFSRGKFLEPLGEISCEFYICGRPEDVDGFAVLSPATGTEEYLLVAAAGFCVDEGSPLTSVFKGRRVETDPKSFLTLDRIQNWLTDCAKNHGHIELGNDVALPSRLVDVEDPSVGMDKVKLREMQGEVGKYVSLSHCWGTSRRFVTTKDTLEERKSGIEISSLPSTFQDAIFIARALGYRYIWIDSICICQDDRTDWERESANMAHVYSNAAVAIAATRSPDDSTGFLGSRERHHVLLSYSNVDISGPVLAFAVPIRIAANPSWDCVNLPEEPLSQRGWALQERYLSQRSLLFSSTQIFFECKTCFVSEDGYFHSRQVDHLGSNELGFTMAKQHPLEGYNPTSRAYAGWKELMCRYVMRKLTKPSDKLPALSGIARAIDERLPRRGQDATHFLAGLWRDNMLEELCWQSVGGRCKRAAGYRAPSWSWVALDGPIGVPELGEMADWAEFEDAHVEVSGANPYGEVSDGWVRIKSVRLRLLFYERRRRFEEEPRSTSTIFRYEDLEDHTVYVGFDVREERLEERLEMRELYFVPIAEQRPPTLPTAGPTRRIKEHVQGLVIEPCDPGNRDWVDGPVYKRVGWHSDSGADIMEYIEAGKKEGRLESITLI